MPQPKWKKLIQVPTLCWHKMKAKELFDELDEEIQENFDAFLAKGGHLIEYRVTVECRIHDDLMYPSDYPWHKLS